MPILNCWQAWCQGKRNFTVVSILPYTAVRNRKSMVADLHTLFQPRSIAVVGASSDKTKLGNILFRNIIAGGFSGELFPINPSSTTIEGCKVYAEYAQIPEVPDLAIIVVPAEIVLVVLQQIILKGTKSVVIISAGFKEMGGEGASREADLQRMVAESGIHLLGPNCLGFVNTFHKLNATFGQGVQQTGSMRFLSQSGAIASSIFDWASYAQLGFSDFVTLGNKTSLTENEILEYWASQETDTEHTGASRFDRSGYNPIGLYLESIVDGTRFIEIAKTLAKRTPLFMLKPGKTDAAKKAMQSHTGAIAGDDAVLDKALLQAGVIRCDGIEDMFDLSRALSWSTIPQGPEVAIISNAGGPAVFSSDAVVAEGLSMATLSEDTIAQLSKQLPRASSLVNPIDVLGDALADRYEQAIRVVFEENKVDSILVILTPQVMTEIEETAQVIGRLSQKYKKPIFCSFMGGTSISKGETILNKYKIPSFRYPERAIKVMGSLWWWRSWQKNALKAPVPQEVVPVPTSSKKWVMDHLETALNKEEKYIDGMAVSAIFDHWDIPTPASALVENLDQAKKFVKDAGFPVVLKLIAPELLHKTEAGGVITGVASVKQLEKASQELIDKLTDLSPKVRKTAKIQIQSQISGGIEVVVGVKKNAQFGNVLMVGAGGTLVELINDRNLLVLPATKNEVKALVEQSKIYTLLKGYRGESAFAVDRLYHLIAQMCNLVETVPYFAEIEINPVIVTKREAYAVDGKVILIDV